MSRYSLTVVHSRYVVPSQEKVVLSDHSLVFDSSGEIVDVLPTELARIRYQSCREVTQPRHLLMPSFGAPVAPGNFSRGLTDDWLHFPWLEEFLTSPEKEHISILYYGYRRRF
eukprot:TRINITY_DN3290_c0_g1_i1.p1 TRINITY_DN3290_c0_g1~~TRINITY_DN3290_c0_g1_i1.p1  ORF type:complete len:113 (-),score=10.95 TRINITY_DN3290_c0_g1_i1:157-495(-)